MILETIKINVYRCPKENLKFVFGNNEENIWAYLFRLQYKPNIMKNLILN